MSEKNLESIGEDIEERLESILRRIGGSRATIAIAPPGTKDISGESVRREAIQNPWKPFVVDGEFMIRYIKDHSTRKGGNKWEHDKEVKQSPNDCYWSGNRVHFYGCTTLQTMKERGREARYREAPLSDEWRKIDLSNAPDVKTKLPWCQNCISELSKWGMLEWANKRKISRYGSSGDMEECVRLRDLGLEEDEQKIQAILQKIIKKAEVTL